MLEYMQMANINKQHYQEVRSYVCSHIHFVSVLSPVAMVAVIISVENITNIVYTCVYFMDSSIVVIP